MNRVTSERSEHPTRVEAGDRIELEGDGLRVIVDESLPSAVAAIGPAARLVRERVRQTGRCDPREHDIDLLVREALTNAVVHGNRRDASKTVRLLVASHETEDDILIVVRDEGAGFEPSQVPSPLRPERLRASHGRGLFLMQTLASDVEFRRRGREVRLRIRGLRSGR